MFSMNRWILRRQRKFLCIALTLLLFMVAYIVVIHEDIVIQEKHYQPFSESCLTGTGDGLVKELCGNYSRGLAYGSLCDDICTNKLFQISSCIHHGTTYVLLGDLANQKVAIKRKQVHNIKELQLEFDRFIDHYSSDITSVQRYFIDRLKSEVQGSNGKDAMNVLSSNMLSISQKLFGREVSLLTVEQMKTSWQLLGQDEVLMLAIHEKMNTITKLLGTCGPVYAIEQVKPYSHYFPEVLPVLPWKNRVKIANGFLDLVEEFQHSEAGPLHHCDIQEANFGLTEDFRVKAIDVDLVYSQNRIDEILPQPKCVKDEDCDFFDCISQCDMESRLCTNKSLTNNLQVICRDIFAPSWPRSGLLSNFQPVHIAQKLKILLDDCKSSSFGRFTMQHSNSINLIKELRHILELSMKSATFL